LHAMTMEQCLARECRGERRRVIRIFAGEIIKKAPPKGRG